jgi:hypothetical protein
MSTVLPRLFANLLQSDTGGLPVFGPINSPGGNSQNCVQACPKGIQITTVTAMNREATKHMFKRLSF